MNRGGKQSIYTKWGQSGSRVLSPFRDRFSPFWDGSHDFGTLEGLPGFCQHYGTVQKAWTIFIKIVGRHENNSGQPINFLGLTVHFNFKIARD